jgi:hypothetical protein
VSLTPGTRLGPYEITAQIGVGGMGEVYRATDMNLARQVAIKVLPDSMAADAERLARFEREAKTLAALNHPNIAAIYGLERSGRQTALVMEFIDGPTLADTIAEGAMPVDEALAAAKQIAEALEAAHEQGIIAEVGPDAAAFDGPKRMSSWVGVCPGAEESAGVNYSHRPPKGNRQMRRLLTAAAHAAVKTKGSIFERVYRRLVPRLGRYQAIGAIAHRLCRLIWKFLHYRVAYEERGPAVTKERLRARTAKMIRELRSLGYRVEPA